MSRSPVPPSVPTPGEMFEEAITLLGGVAAGAPMLPGFLLCVPALATVLVLVLLPLVVVGLLITVLLLVLLLAAAPVVVGVRVARHARAAMPEPGRATPAMTASGSRA